MSRLESRLRASSTTSSSATTGGSRSASSSRSAVTALIGGTSVRGVVDPAARGRRAAGVLGAKRVNDAQASGHSLTGSEEANAVVRGGGEARHGPCVLALMASRLSERACHPARGWSRRPARLRLIAPPNPQVPPARARTGSGAASTGARRRRGAPPRAPPVDGWRQGGDARSSELPTRPALLSDSSICCVPPSVAATRRSPRRGGAPSRRLPPRATRVPRSSPS